MDPEGYPIPQSDSWIPSNLNLSAQGVMVEEARAEGCAWSPSYLNLNLSEECVCPPGQPMIESPQNQEQERVPSLRLQTSVRTVGEGDFQQSNYLIASHTSDLIICTCPKTRGAGEEENKQLSATVSKDAREDPRYQESPPPIPGSTYAYIERCNNVCPGICKGPDAQLSLTSDKLQTREGRGASTSAPLRGPTPAASFSPRTGEAGQSLNVNDKSIDPLEDVYVWEARSYTGSADSEALEKLRLEGKLAIPKAPGERSEESIENVSKKETDERKIKSPILYDNKHENAVQNVPEKGLVVLEDVYVWEARSYTGSADSDAQEQLRIVGMAPIPKGPGERSEEDIGGQRDITDDFSRPLPDQCTTSCRAACKDLPACPPTVSTQPRIVTPKHSQHDVPGGELRRPCGCRVSLDKLQLQQASAGEEAGKPQKRPCPCPDAADSKAGAQGQCVCKHCKKKREKLQEQAAITSEQPRVAEGPANALSQHTTGVAGQQIVCKPCTTQTQNMGQSDEASEFQCFCKPTVHDRVEYLTNLLIEGVSPLNEALDTIHMKMKSMGFFGNGNCLKCKNKGPGTGSTGGGRSGSRGERRGSLQDPPGTTRGSEPSVAIYIMSPGTVLSPMATKIHPHPPEINAISQVNKTTSVLGPLVEDTGDYSEGNIQVPCCQLQCCPRRHKSPQVHSKP